MEFSLFIPDSVESGTMHQIRIHNGITVSESISLPIASRQLDVSQKLAPSSCN
jgi:hypothetical protein